MTSTALAILHVRLKAEPYVVRASPIEAARDAITAALVKVKDWVLETGSATKTMLIGKVKEELRRVEGVQNVVIAAVAPADAEWLYREIARASWSEAIDMLNTLCGWRRPEEPIPEEKFLYVHAPFVMYGIIYQEHKGTIDFSALLYLPIEMYDPPGCSASEPELPEWVGVVAFLAPIAVAAAWLLLS